jgi:hypothetical protein
MARDPRARAMEKVIKLLVKDALPDGEMWRSYELLREVIVRGCGGVDPSVIDPILREDSVDVHHYGYLWSLVLRAVTLFDFAHLVRQYPIGDQLRGTIVFAYRARFTEPHRESLRKMRQFARSLQNVKGSRIIDDLIDAMWAAFDMEINGGLKARVTKPERLVNSTVFEGVTPSTCTKYQDVQFLSLYRLVCTTSAELGISLPDYMIPQPVPHANGGKAVKELASATVIVEPTVETNAQKIVPVLRDFMGMLAVPTLLHKSALGSVIPLDHYPPLPPLQLPGDWSDLISFSDIAVTPSLKQLDLTNDHLTFSGEQSFSIENLLDFPKSVVAGLPGSGGDLLLTRLAHQVNNGSLHDGGLPLMIVMDAVDYVTQSGQQWLPAFAAQKVQRMGCCVELGMNDLARCLERLDKDGRLLWGIYNVDEGMENKLDEIGFQVGLLDHCIVVSNTPNRPFIQRVQRMLDGGMAFWVQGFGVDQVTEYCKAYAALTSDDLVSARALQMAESCPDLAALWLGSACICAVASNLRRLQNPVHLYIAELACRAGLSPDSSLLTSAQIGTPVIAALCQIAVKHWRANSILDGSPLMEQKQVVSWLTNSDDSKVAQVSVPQLLSTGLVIRSYDGGGLHFALPSVYHLALAVGSLNARERRIGRLVFPLEVRRELGDQLPERIVKFISELVYLRLEIAGLLHGDD